MTASGQSILVVGGGIGGMSSAIALAQRGFAVDLVEIDPEWGVSGAGITITGPTYRAFAELGLLDQLKKHGFESRGGTRICNGNGNVLMEVPVQALGPGFPPLGGIMRPVLHELLSRETRARGVNVQLGVTIDGWDDEAECVRVSFSDGRQQEYAVVIIADGAYSQNRGRVAPDAPEPHYTGQYCWRLVADRPQEIDRGYIYSADGIFAGLVPTSETQMYMWLLEPRAEKRRIEPGTEHVLLDELMTPFSGLLGQLRDGLGPQSIINVRPLDSVLVPGPWYSGRVILIGDAAHSTTPHLASGAGIAVEDAVVLATLFGEACSLEQKLARFMEIRWERCRDVVESSVAIGAMQQSVGASPQALGALVGAAGRRLDRDIWAEPVKSSAGSV